MRRPGIRDSPARCSIVESSHGDSSESEASQLSGTRTESAATPGRFSGQQAESDGGESMASDEIKVVAQVWRGLLPACARAALALTSV